MTTGSRIAVLLSTDLMLGSQLEGIAKRCGWSLRSATSWDRLRDFLSASDVRLVIVDLSMPQLALDKAEVDALTSRAIWSVAFGPHVHRERLSAARSVGFSQVVSRGQVLHEVEALLGGEIEGSGRNNDERLTS
jgi:hypothetical protein